MVTGSSRGLGLVFARGLAQAGATVVLNERSGETLQQAVTGLKGEELDATGYSFDVMNRQQVTEQVGRIEREIGPINICSMMSEVGRSTIAPYTAAKGGVKMLTRAMAVEWAKYNVQVNGLGPGYFATEMNKALIQDPKFDRWIRQRTPAGRYGRWCSAKLKRVRDGRGGCPPVEAGGQSDAPG